MKYPGLKVFLVRAFEYGSAIAAATTFGQGLTEYDEDGRIASEPYMLCQFGNDFSYLLDSLERFLAGHKQQIYNTFQRVNSDEDWEDEREPIKLVLHCINPYPQVVLEVGKVLKRYSDDEDLYELVDIVIKMDPRRVEDAEERQKCEKFQADLFA